jgi:hypothetical protein
MSANCFRRDALRLFLLDEGLAKLRGSLGGFLLRALSLVVGSVLIDRPLSIYRLHGSNSYKRSGPSDRNALVCKMVSDCMISKAKLFLSKMYSAEQYIDTLAALENAWPPFPSTVAGCHTYLAGKVVSESRALARELRTAKFGKLLNLRRTLNQFGPSAFSSEVDAGSRQENAIRPGERLVQKMFHVKLRTNLPLLRDKAVFCW